MKFKYLFFITFIIFSIFQLLKISASPPKNPCDFFAIRMDVPLQLLEATTSDGGQNTALTRFFHNKPLFYSTNFTQCYLNYFHPWHLMNLLSIVGFLLFLCGIYHFFFYPRSKLSKIFFILFLIIPLFIIFGILKNPFAAITFYFLLWPFSFYGLVFFCVRILKV